MVRKKANYDLNFLMWKRFKEVSKQSIPLSGPVIKAKTLKYANDIEIEDFKASEGCLDKFKARQV